MKSKRWVWLEIMLVLCGIITMSYLLILWVELAPSEARIAQEGQAMSPERPTAAYGYASWYGRRFHGLRTSNGEHFDMNLYTAAHKTLPMGAWVRVTNMRNSKIVWVRINDRGPYLGDRIIDLSYRAAKDLEMVEEGVEEVKVEVVDWHTTPRMESPREVPVPSPAADGSSGSNTKRV